MNNKLVISKERKEYLKQIKKKKYLVLFTQIAILVAFLGIWEWMANQNIIDSFITSQPSRILATFMDLTSNDLLRHIGVTTYETVVGFLSSNLAIALIDIFSFKDFCKVNRSSYVKNFDMTSSLSAANRYRIEKSNDHDNKKDCYLLG